MGLRWTVHARDDLVRLHDFLEPVDARAAARVVRTLLAGVRRIPRHPRLGARLAEFSGREVRRLLVGPYEVRNEVADPDVTILRIWHTAEDR